MHSLSFHFFAIISLLVGRTIALPVAPDDVNISRDLTVKSARTTNTCADPTQAQTVYQSWIVQLALHGLDFGPTCEATDTSSHVLVCADRQPSFLAWPTQQDFTFPLFKLTAADGKHIIYRTGTDAQTPPVVSGFTGGSLLIGWVYNTQVCGSVPLMSALFTPTSDRLYTTNPWEHDRLVALGFVDGGVAAFVLPLDYS